MTELVQEQTNDMDGLEPEFIRILAIVMLFTLGIMMFIFSLALMEDLSTLSQAPELVWAFICGAPSAEGPALPLMLTLTTLAFGAGIGITGWHIWQKRK
jgi:hypothetical protein